MVSSGNGGGMMIVSSAVTINNSKIFKNYAEDSGGGIHSTDSDININQVSIIENYSNNNTAGIYFNNGNLIAKCNGWIEFRDIDGLSIEKIELDEIPRIYPLERRSFEVEIPNDLVTGEYSALAVIDYGGAQLVAGEVIFKYIKYNQSDE